MGTIDFILIVICVACSVIGASKITAKRLDAMEKSFNRNIKCVSDRITDNNKRLFEMQYGISNICKMKIYGNNIINNYDGTIKKKFYEEGDIVVACTPGRKDILYIGMVKECNILNSTYKLCRIRMDIQHGSYYGPNVIFDERIYSIERLANNREKEIYLTNSDEFVKSIRLANNISNIF